MLQGDAQDGQEGVEMDQDFDGAIEDVPQGNDGDASGSDVEQVQRHPAGASFVGSEHMAVELLLHSYSSHAYTLVQSMICLGIMVCAVSLKLLVAVGCVW